jgi:hypothetical protein
MSLQTKCSRFKGVSTVSNDEQASVKTQARIDGARKMPRNQISTKAIQQQRRIQVLAVVDA